MNANSTPIAALILTLIMTTATPTRRQAFLASYFELMEAGACDATTPMYVASGLLTYLSPDGAAAAA